MARNRGFADVVVGIQWGDEGKAKILTYLLNSGTYGVTARFNGGSNAGHTAYYKGHKVGFHQLPSGVLVPNTELYSGSGTVINPVKYSAEIRSVEELAEKLGENFYINDRLSISGEATVVQPHHIIIDGLKGKKVATTGNGIGPAYVDQAARMNDGILLNIRMIDLKRDPEKYLKLIRENLERVVNQYNVTVFLEDGSGGKREIAYPVEEKMREFESAVEHLSDMITDDPLYLERRIERGENILFEGANGGLLDKIKGTVPNVTSSVTTPGGAFSADLPPNDRRYTYGVLKIIPSRVGRGSFPGEYGGEISEEYTLQNGGNAHKRDIEFSNYDPFEELASCDWFRVGRGLRMRGDEYGTTTGRPRRIGKLDLILTDFATRLFGVDRLVVTKADLMRDFRHTRERKIPVINGYSLNGMSIDFLPMTEEDARELVTNVRYLDSFEEDITGATDYREFPAELKALLNLLENSTPRRCKLYGIGTGPGTDNFVLAS